MSKAIYKKVMCLLFLTLAIYSIIFSYLYCSYSLKETKSDMIRLIDELDSKLDSKLDYNGDIQSFADNVIYYAIVDNCRITVISPDGNVIADTDRENDLLDNHGKRPEIVSALSGNIGVSIRYSATLGKNMLYIAKKSAVSDNIIRTAIPYSNKIMFVKTLLPTIVITTILTMVLAFLITGRTVKSITQPLMALTREISKVQSGEDLKLETYKYKELNDIAAAINEMSDRVDGALNRITEINRRTEYILDNMKDGLVFIDHNKNVIGINDAAREILECKDKEKYLNIIHYTRNLKIVDAVNDAIQLRKESTFDITLEDERVFSVHISRVMKGVIEKNYGGVIILLIDVTAIRQNEKLRENFFANASHELKTPITSIKGYSELLTSNIPYDNEKKEEFLNRIKKESDNLTSLINDILAISRMESGNGEQEKETFNIRTMLEDMLCEFEPMLNENDITMELYCNDIVITEEKAKFATLFNNLISNAVKYNVKGGRVSVTVANTGNKIFIEVSDTGIGIPAVDRTRVFERFYRVDKGRSKKIGGTGLGLAIVKHIVNYYKGMVTLNSEVDKGTTVKLELNINK